MRHARPFAAARRFVTCCAVFGWCLSPVAASAQAGVSAVPPPVAPQNPSPMLETTRTHERLTPKSLGGTVRAYTGPAGKPVELWVPDGARARDVFDVVIHFHGAAWLPQQAVAALGSRTVAVVLDLGAGSGIYDRSFADPRTFDSLLVNVAHEVSAVTGHGSRLACRSRDAGGVLGWSRSGARDPA